jgi:dihydrodipicolinate synthase/N-acetylneuraminate lyase
VEASNVAGIWPILYAFFGEDGRVDRAAMRRQLDACVAGGAHGIAVMGLATEVGKLDVRERREVVEWVAEDLDGRAPLAVTIAEPSVPGQVEMARAAAALGAGWVILQPPPVAGLPELEYVRFFGAVADRVPLPVAIQNAPGYLGVALSGTALRELRRQHPNVCLLKAEGPAAQIHRLIEDTEGAFRVLNGRGGLELPDSLRAGCVGLIPAPECFDVQVQIYELLRTGRPDAETEAERLYREILPLIVFLMQSVEHFLCYGKRIAARRLGLGPVHDRPPAERPTPFGLASAARYAAHLGPYGPRTRGAPPR